MLNDHQCEFDFKSCSESGVPDITLPYSYGTDGWDSPVEWLIQDYLPFGKIGMLFGESQDLKTFLALQMAASIATGHSFGGLPVEKGLVIYVAGESPGSVPRRLKAIEDKSHVSIGEGVIVINRALSPTCDDDLEELEALISYESARQQLRPALLVLDTFSQCSAGIDENSARDVAHYLRSCTQIADKFGMVVLNVHHRNKDGGYRGSSALVGNVDFVLQTKKAKDKSRIATTLSVLKAKDSNINVAHEFEMEEVELGVIDNLGRSVTSLAVNTVKATSAVDTLPQVESDAALALSAVKCANDWVAQSEIRLALNEVLQDVKEGVLAKRVSKACSYLIEQGLLEERKEGRGKAYRITLNT